MNKRILALLLTLALAFGLALPAFAAAPVVAAEPTCLVGTRIIDPGVPGFISPSINWFALFRRVFSFITDPIMDVFSFLSRRLVSYLSREFWTAIFK